MAAELVTVQVLSATIFGREHLMPGPGEQVGHVGGPPLALQCHDCLQLTEVMGVAQGMGGGEAAPICRPAVVDEDPLMALDDAHVLQGFFSPVVGPGGRG